MLVRWHKSETQLPDRRLTESFETFIQTILFEKPNVSFTADKIHVFGRLYPIHFDCLSAEDRAYVQTEFIKKRDLYFQSVTNLTPKYYVYSEPWTPVQIDMISRRELVRAFVWLVVSSGIHCLVTSLIGALQSVILKHRSDVFLATVHFSIQSNNFPIEELVCWNLSASDRHPDDIRNLTH